MVTRARAEEDKKPEMKTESVEVPKVMRRAIAMVSAELRSTIAEAAEALGIDQRDGWKLKLDMTAFERRVKK